MIDDFNHEGLGVEVDLSLPSQRVIWTLKQIIEWRGKRQQNDYIERYNRIVRYDWLKQHLFNSIEKVQDHATKWLWLYNYESPNMANGDLPPCYKTALNSSTLDVPKNGGEITKPRGFN